MISSRIIDILNTTVRGYSHNHAVATTANTSGSPVDCINTHGPLTAIMNIFGAAGTLSQQIKFQESTDGTTWADISGASFAAATTNGVSSLTIPNRTLRYVRSYSTVATSSSCSLSTLIIGALKQVP